MCPLAAAGLACRLPLTTHARSSPRSQPSKVAYWASLLNAALLSRHLSEPIGELTLRLLLACAGLSVALAGLHGDPAPAALTAERRELDWRDLHRQFGGEGDTDSEDMRSGASAVVDGEASADDGSGDGEDETDSDWEGSESDEGSTTDDDDDVDVDDDEEVEEEDEEEEPLEDEVDEAEPEGGDGEGVEGGHGDGVEGGDGEGGSGEGEGPRLTANAGDGVGSPHKRARSQRMGCIANRHRSRAAGRLEEYARAHRALTPPPV